MAALRTIVEPNGEPLTLAEVKNFLRVDFSDDDLLIESLITAARRWVETYCRRRMLYQTVRLELDYFPGTIDPRIDGGLYASLFASGANAVLAGIRYAIRVPYPPLHHVAAFTFQDQNGTVTPVASVLNYVTDADSEPARLMPPFGQFWPVAQVIGNAVRIDFVCGYGANLGVSTTQGSAAIAGYTFVPEDVGSSIAIPGAGVAGATLLTTIASVDASGNGTAATTATTAVSNAQAYLGRPVPACMLAAMRLLCSQFYNNRDAVAVGGGAPQEMPFGVKSLLSPYRDLRL